MSNHLMQDRLAKHFLRPRFDELWTNNTWHTSEYFFDLSERAMWLPPQIHISTTDEIPESRASFGPSGQYSNHAFMPWSTRAVEQLSIYRQQTISPLSVGMHPRNLDSRSQPDTQVPCSTEGHNNRLGNSLLVHWYGYNNRLSRVAI